MKNINKEQAIKFVSSKDGKKILLYVGVGILIAILWKTLLIVGLVVGLGYAIIKYRDRKSDSFKTRKEGT